MNSLTVFCSRTLIKDRSWGFEGPVISSGNIQLPLRHCLLWTTDPLWKSLDLVRTRNGCTRVRPEKPNNSNVSAPRPWPALASGHTEPRAEVKSSANWQQAWLWGDSADSSVTLSWLAEGSNFTTCWRQCLILFQYLKKLLKPECNHVASFPHPPGAGRAETDTKLSCCLQRRRCAGDDTHKGRVNQISVFNPEPWMEPALSLSHQLKRKG